MGATSVRHNPSFEVLQDIVGPIAKKYGVTRVYLFGSRARGDNNSESDFDFCITPGEIKGMIPMCGFLTDLEEALGKNVDIVTDRSLSEDLAQEVYRYGRLVYEAGP
jgi:predicted nucleotidyltransferase